ncbi:peptide deformylase [Flavobacterium azooxidireducens]|uniref:Peptide deformylase n=1 Tax=Flavobacterium azooxidireducens TaxID=1871076 RepID=A0ABY4KHD4_9FLAO|nr:peptide deformylase [Flavobacterium azooxidireducens]UPQ78847.1 peptide deformylase [Flavobacterium azooxidireducens]
MKNSILVSFLLISIVAFSQKFTKEERDFILEADSTQMFKVIQITEPNELKILKAVSTDVNPKDKLIPHIAKRMYLAMRNPANPGIGIAAPQVGINRNLFWVQRLDKPGEPFEFYINPKIVWQSDLLRKGMEGCLSIPEDRGDVYRNYTIKVTYFDLKGNFKEEMIEGFTAVIFQHEEDHLNGILFTDRINEQTNWNVQSINNDVNLFLKKKLKRN